MPKETKLLIIKNNCKHVILKSSCLVDNCINREIIFRNLKLIRFFLLASDLWHARHFFFLDMLNPLEVFWNYHGLSSSCIILSTCSSVAPDFRTLLQSSFVICILLNFILVDCRTESLSLPAESPDLFLASIHWLILICKKISFSQLLPSFLDEEDAYYIFLLFL